MWLSGRKRHRAKVLEAKASRGFEPHRLRLRSPKRRASADAVRQKIVAKERRNMHIVYILKCIDGKPYTGCTENLEERLTRHNNGYVPATESRRPVKLVTHVVFNDKHKAFEFEKYLKSGSGRAFVKKHLM